MHLEDKDIREFSELWQMEFHQALSLGEARRDATSLLELYALLAQPPCLEASEPFDTSTDNCSA
jgi:hypothetical protein